MKIEFFLPMIIPTVTQQEHKIAVVKGKPIVYEPAELKTARSKFEAHLAKHIPPEPLSGAISLNTVWCFEPTAGHRNGEFKTTRPDTDNLIKMFKDVCTKLGYWNDDAQVAVEQTMKIYLDKTGILVCIEQLDKLAYMQKNKNG